MEGDIRSRTNSAVTTIRRNVSVLGSNINYKAELDSHADTCCFGSQAYIVQDTGETISVEPFIGTLGKVDSVPIITAAIAYDDPETFQTYILFFHQSLYFKNLNKHLLCPNQMRNNQVTVNDTPLLHIPPHLRQTTSHSILTEEPQMHIPLELDGTTSFFYCRKPTEDEITSNSRAIHVHMTSDMIWEPYDPSHGNGEAAIRAALMSNDSKDYTDRQITSVATSAAIDVHQAVSNTHRLYPSIMSTRTFHRKGTVDADALARRWRIGRDAAKRTIERTTQRAVRDFTNAKGGRRLKPVAYQLRYPRLNVEMYTDTLIGPNTSLLGNKYAQIYCTKFHWIMAFPMKQKSEAHYALDTLFQQVGLPRVLMPDNAKEMTLGQFKSKASMKMQVPANTSNRSLYL